MSKGLFFLFITPLFLFSQNGGGCSGVTISSATNTGVHTVFSYDESTGVRNGPDYYGSTLYCPENTVGLLPSIIIIPGYANPELSIQSWGPFLASHGIVCMTIGTNSVFDLVDARKDALKDALISLKEENFRSSSFLYNKLDTSLIALGGWSMGGGGAQLLAVENPAIKAVLALCPWLDPSQAPSSLLNQNSPVLFFSGQIDAVAPPSTHANAQYNYTPSSTKKLIYEVFLGGHTVANNPSGGQGEVGRMALSWLKTYLENDSCYCPLLLNVPLTSSDYQTNIDCSNLVSQPNTNTSCSVYPNPFKNHLYIAGVLSNSSYRIINVFGVVVKKGGVTSSPIDLSNLVSGVYFLEVPNKKVTLIKY